jgi:chaperone BCS1
MSMFFNKTYQANDNGHPQLLDFENVIFVLEDVDAATDVVKKRPKKKKKKKKKDAPTPTAPAGQNSAFPNVPAYRSSPIPDKLNLTGILNVLDGVVSG